MMNQSYIDPELSSMQWQDVDAVSTMYDVYRVFGIDKISVELPAELSGASTRTISVDVGDDRRISAVLLDGSVASSKIADNAVCSNKLSDAAVQTRSIADSAVTYSKLSDDVVNYISSQCTDSMNYTSSLVSSMSADWHGDASKTVVSVHQEDGKISLSAASIEISASQVKNLGSIVQNYVPLSVASISASSTDKLQAESDVCAIVKNYINALDSTGVSCELGYCISAIRQVNGAVEASAGIISVSIQQVSGLSSSLDSKISKQDFLNLSNETGLSAASSSNPVATSSDLSRYQLSGNYLSSNALEEYKTYNSTLSALSADGYALVNQIPLSVSQLKNDAGYLTEHQSLSDYYMKSETSSSSEISDEFKKYQLSGQYLSSNALEEYKTYNATVSSLSGNGYALKTDIPTDLSDLSNNSGYVTSSDVSIELKKYQLSGKYLSSNALDSYATYNATLSSLSSDGYALTSQIPLSVSQLENDSGYLTEHQSLSDYYTKSQTSSSNQLSDEFKKYQLSGNYLSSNALERYKTYADTVLSLSSSGYALTSDIPTDLSDFNNGSGYVTSNEVSIELKKYQLSGDYLSSNALDRYATYNATLSQLSNDGYALTSSIPADLSAFSNSPMYVMSSQISDSIDSIDKKIFIDDRISGVHQYSDLSIIKLSAYDYDQLVISDQTISNGLYIVDYDFEDAYGMQVKNVAAATDLSDAPNLEQVSGMVDNATRFRHTELDFSDSDTSSFIIDGQFTRQQLIDISAVDSSHAWLKMPKHIAFGTALSCIGAGALSGCTALESISFPETLSRIEASAFYGCSSLRTVYIPGSIEFIGDAAFSQCSALQLAVIGAGCHEVNDAALVYESILMQHVDERIGADVAAVMNATYSYSQAELDS